MVNSLSYMFGALIVGLNYFLLYGFKRFDGNVGTTLLSTELFFAAIFGAIFFGELPTLNEFLGGMCIFAASIMAFVNVGALKQMVKRGRAAKK